MQGNGIKNGRLPELLKESQFGCWIVADKNIPYQQNVTKILCIIVVLAILRYMLAHITPFFSDILLAIENRPLEKR
jgi:hypothetical protein